MFRESIIWKECTKHFKRLLEAINNSLFWKVVSKGKRSIYPAALQPRVKVTRVLILEVLLYRRISANKFQRNDKMAVLQLLMEKQSVWAAAITGAESVRSEMNGDFLSLFGWGRPHLNPQIDPASPTEGSVLPGRCAGGSLSSPWVSCCTPPCPLCEGTRVQSTSDPTTSFYGRKTEDWVIPKWYHRGAISQIQTMGQMTQFLKQMAWEKETAWERTC